MAEEKENVKDKGLILLARKAYGIEEKYLFASKVYPDDEVVLVTHGGAKVRWKKGDEVEPLDPVRVDGIIRKKMKPVTGGKKKPEGQKSEVGNQKKE